MSCNARVAAADAKMGLPELQLGENINVYHLLDCRLLAGSRT